MTERPQFIDGLNASFEQTQKALSTISWPGPELKPNPINPDLTLLEDSVSGAGHWEYYADQKGKLIAHLEQEHESGVTMADWVIDHSPESPLFMVGMSAFDRKSFGFYLGFQSRGVRTEPTSKHLFFSKITARYMLLGERLAFDDIPSISQRSLTTGEEVEVTTDETGDSVVLASRLANGALEEITLPQSLDFMWLSKVNQSSAIRDSSLPYLQWPAIVGAQFSLKTPFGQTPL